MYKVELNTNKQTTRKIMWKDVKGHMSFEMLKILLLLLMSLKFAHPIEAK